MKLIALLISLFAACVVSSLRATCPTPNFPSPQSWQIPAVNYNFPTPGPPPAYLTNVSIASLGIQADIDSAFNEWSTANQANGALVEFYSSGSNGPYRVYAYRVNDPTVAGPYAAHTDVALYGGTRTIAFVSTELYIGTISSSGYPNYDENAGTYHAFIKKVMLHEIGHTMDLTDQPFVVGAQCGGQVAGESVMNYQCGTNDRGKRSQHGHSMR